MADPFGKFMRPSLFNAAIAGIFATGATLAAPALVQAQTCQFLAPVGGNGTTNIVLKTVGPAILLAVRTGTLISS